MDIKSILQEALKVAAQRSQAAGELKAGNLAEITFEVPPQKEFGDFATNCAMQSARNFHMSPRAIAQALVKHLDMTYIEKVEIAGPGFLNFYLRKNWTDEVLRGIIAKGEEYGNLPPQGGDTIQVEYVSANPTGPLHVGHGRGAAVGSTLVNLLKAAGYSVRSEYYINDAGNQMNNLAASVNARYLALYGVEVPFPEDGYHGEDIVVTAQRIKDRYGDKFLHMEEAERLKAFRLIGREEKLAALREDLEAFNVQFDEWFSETTLHTSGKIKEACDELLAKGHMYEQDGALWLRSTTYGDDKDRVVIRDNGVPTYLAADIAYHRNKLQRGFGKLINLWGADHHGYIVRMKAALAAMGYNPDNLEIILLQMVSLYRNGELVKMSKRTGQSVTLNELIEEVGTDAARFFFVLRSVDSQLDFDMTLATEHSTENPVFYVQYAHARIASIFRQMAAEGITVGSELPSGALTQECEIELVKKLGEYEELIALAARDRAVHRIARYELEVAGLFHSFYNQCRILGVDERVQQARLLLVKAVGHVIEHGLGILGVSAPDRM